MGEMIVKDAVVVGAGFAGMYMLYRLRSAGLSVQVFEAATDVGGTWHWNRYPGARCDAESIEYSYSFDDALQQEWNWTERFATQPEIRRYAEHVADRFELRRDIRFNTRVTSAIFDKETLRWTIETDKGEAVSARYFINAVGCLSQPKAPDIAGLEKFGGEILISSSWPESGVNFAGKHVGVIGTGSTGTQIIPEIAKEAKHLTVFQRTPNFTVPARNAALSDTYITEVKANYAELRRRARVFGSAGASPPERSALEVTAEERRQAYEAFWEIGGPTLQIVYNDLMIDEAANKTAADFIRQKIAETVKDPDLARKLSPTGYPLGAKRLCVGTDYYETYNRENVSLIDLLETPLETITEKGVRTSAREVELDVIVLATGFDAITGALLAMDIRGSDGLALADKWRDGPKTYLGLAVSGFPNMFIITGPGSPSVLGNVMVSIEQHVEWIDRLVQYMEAHDIAALDADETAEQNWVDHVNAVAAMTLYPKGNSWYVGANIPGKPRMFLPYVGGMAAYSAQCDAVADAGFEGFREYGHAQVR